MFRKYTFKITTTSSGGQWVNSFMAIAGVGAIYVRRRPRVRIEAPQSGGGQERGMRSGTVPTPLVVGLGAACELSAQEMEVGNCLPAFVLLMNIHDLVKSWNCGCLVTWFCYQLIAKPGNKIAAFLMTWPDCTSFNVATFMCRSHGIHFINPLIGVDFSGTHMSWVNENATE